MKIILLQDVAHVGKKNEITDVSDGFARNFLFPKKLALLANEQTQLTLVANKESEERKKSAEREKYVKLAEKLRSLHVVIKIKVGGKGKAFGSVTAAKIAEQLKAQHHIEIEKEWIHLDEPLKSTGIKEVPVKFPYGIESALMVTIEPESDSEA